MPITLKQSDEVAFGPYGGAELFFADIDGDGQVEILAYQGPGVFGTKMYHHFPQVAAAYPKSTCLTAFKKDGTRLWTFGEPNPTDRPYICHAHESIVATGDVDGDGVIEVALADGDTIHLLDGPTGKPRGQAKLDRDNFYIVQILGEPTDKGEAALVVKNGEGGTDHWRYGEPLIGFDKDMNVAIEPVDIPGAGHHILVLDLDGDGRSEYLVGYCMLKPSGEWSGIPESIDPANVDAGEEHVDYTDVLWLSDTEFLLGFAGSNRGYLVRNDGRTLFSRPDTHVQGCAVGRFRSDSEYQIIIYNDNGPLVLYDARGTELWRIPTDERWPLGMPHAPSCHSFHRNRPVIKFTLDKDYLLFTDGGWPWGMDGDGEIVVDFEVPANSEQPELDIPKQARGDDMGYGYATKIVDWAGNGTPHAVIYDRRHLWAYPLEAK